MKWYVRSSEELDIKQGFFFEFKNRAIFLVSDSANITDKIARKFINVVCDLRQVSDSIRNAALYDGATLKDFKKRIDRATLERINTGKIVYYTIKGKGFTLCFPEDEFKETVIMI